MKRLMRKQSGNRRGGDSNRDGTVLDSAPAPRLPVNELPVVRTRQNHSPKSPTAWTSNTEAGVQQQQQQHHQRQRQEGMAKLEPISHMTRGLSAPSTLADSGGDDGTLPTAWRIDIMSLRHSDPLCICMNSISKATVCSNRPVVTRQLKIGADVYPGRPKPGDYHTQVYYFEVSIICNQLSSAAGIVIGFMNERGSVGIGPGEVANSIGWGSDGLLVNGRRLDAGQNSCFRDGDVIGCGMEIGGMYSVFFTMNGQMVIPPSAATAFVSQKDLPWYPATSFRHGNGSFLMGNFGIDPRTPFRWQGSNQLNILSTQGAGWSRAQTVSFSHLPTASTSHVATSHAESAEQFQQPFPYSSTTPSTYRMESRHNDSLSRSMPESITQSTNSSARPFPNSTFSDEAAKQPSYFGERNHHKSLEDDDPATMSAALHDHFNLQPSATGSKLPATSNVAALQVASWSSPRAPLSVQSTTTYPAADPSSKDNYSNRWHERGNESRSRREQNRKERLTRRTDGRGLSGGSHSPTTSCSSLSNSSHYPPRSTDSSSVPDTSRMDQKTPEPVISETRIASRTLTTGNEVPIAKEHAQALIKAAKQITFDGSTVHTLLEMCKADQEKLQLKLSNALEEADAIENLEELFAVNDEICVAINAGNQALEREKMLSKKKKKKSMDGPAIQLLVENEDIFSLICMLRASNEKRIQAALALMRFARGNESLRNEIRSSGGMHSFLTLFRTKGTSEPLKVISSMAMAYILPSFVASSQTSASVGLKIIECLRYLVISSPVETVDYAISRPEMLKAASMGVNVLWINAIQPLLILESTKVQSSQVKPELRPSASLRISRVRERAGGSLLDQGQESIELHELTELAVTLITHVAKISDSPSEEPLDVGYNIVEQVCEVDVARPIAVREGLLTTLVEWVRSNQMEKVRPAASALRYLISINDQYMAGWIHSQVVSEGAVNEIVKLLNQSVGHDTRVAVAQMLSALCVAPHTRAAVVGAKCVSYLVALLYEHTAPASAEMVYFAATSLLQLAAGAMIRAAASLMNDITVDAADRDHHEAVIK